MATINTNFWVNDLNVLFDKTQIVYFWPLPNMTSNEKLNAITRFVILASILTAIYYKKTMPLYLGLAIIVCISIFGQQAIKEAFSLYSEKPCKTPTYNNPFMNVSVADYDKPQDTSQACKYNDKITQDATNEFNKGLFQDVNDIFNKQNSQRQFYTMPVNSVPNNQGDFANWCYRKDKVCKAGDQEVCTGFENGGGGGL